jgi:hypothetical protein
LRNAARIAVRNCRPPKGTDVFLALAGEGSEDVSLYNNNLAGANTICDFGPDVPTSALIRWANHPSP